MVAGINRSLEAGKTYSYADLEERFGVDGEALGAILGSLVKSGRLRLPLSGPRWHRGSPTFERDLVWVAVA